VSTNPTISAYSSCIATIACQLVSGEAPRVRCFEPSSRLRNGHSEATFPSRKATYDEVQARILLSCGRVRRSC